MTNPRVGLATDQSPDFISHIDQVLSQVGTILPGDTSDQCTSCQGSLRVKPSSRQLTDTTRAGDRPAAYEWGQKASKLSAWYGSLPRGVTRVARHGDSVANEEARTCVSTAPAAGPDGPLRVCLLSYRSKPHCGGQGIYLRHLSRELAALGHHVEVYSGQPYPELEPGPHLIELPSLDLYRDDDPFRTPHLREYRDWIDVLEFATMKTGAFPEPLTFSLRALRLLRTRRADFDLVHDNQVLAYGMLGLPRIGLPLVTSIHHPISVDRRIEIKAARGLRKIPKWRWYSFVGMQGRVARRIGPVLTGSESSKADILRE